MFSCILNCNKNMHLCRSNIRLISKVINPEPIFTVHQRSFANLNKQITTVSTSTNLLKTFSCEYFFLLFIFNGLILKEICL